MTIFENNAEYILITPSSEEDRHAMIQMMELEKITLWVSKEGKIDGIKIWKK